jgi:hypothetical protein
VRWIGGSEAHAPVGGASRGVATGAAALGVGAAGSEADAPDVVPRPKGQDRRTD